MQDRFKFRVWDKEKEQFTYEYLDREIVLSLDGEVYAIADDYDDSINIYGINNDNQFVFEQCTGLKDKNGKLIYEGDIVKQYDRHRNLLRTGWIVYNVNEMKFKIRTERNPDWNDKTDDFSFHPLKQKLEVIGNIHEQGDKTDE